MYEQLELRKFVLSCVIDSLVLRGSYASIIVGMHKIGYSIIFSKKQLSHKKNMENNSCILVKCFSELPIVISHIDGCPTHPSSVLVA